MRKNFMIFRIVIKMYVIKENKNLSRNFPTKQRLFSESFSKNRSLKLELDSIVLSNNKQLEKIEESSEEQLNETSLFENRLKNDNNILINRNSTISTTLDSISNPDINKEVAPSTFKRKSNFYKRNDGTIKSLDIIIDNLTKERNEVLLNNMRDLDCLNKSYIHILLSNFKDQSTQFLDNYRKKLDEKLIIERNLKEEINLLNVKWSNLETNNIHIEDHQKIIEDLNFTCEMQKRIYSEKIKYYNTLLEEVNERENVSYISNFDNTILNFTNSSLLDKSVFLVSNQENIIDKRKSTEDVIYNSLVLKENTIIGNISNFKPKFLSK